MEVNVVDRGNLVGARVTTGGYLVADVLCARTGIQEYHGYELGMDSMDVVRVYRPEEEVFSPDSLATYVGKPTTDDHPPVPVDSSNWSKYAKGQIGEGVLREGEFIKVPITLMDKSLVEKVMDNKRELSMGYSMTLEHKQGLTPDNEEYDVIARDLKMNHMAVVHRARAGRKARIGDDSKTEWGVSPIIGDVTMTLVKVTVDGIPVETTPQGAAVIAKLEKDMGVLTADASTAELDHKKEMADKDKELATADSKILDLEKKILGDDELDELIATRLDIITKATAVCADEDFKGKSLGDIKKACVIKIHGDSMKDKSDDYIDTAFDLIDSKDFEPKDKVRHVVKLKDHDKKQVIHDHASMVKKTTENWRK